jgi:hypothetical protein
MAKVIIIDDALRDQFAALSSRQPSLSPPSPATEAAAAAALVSSPVALHSRSSLSSEASPTSVADVAATGAAAAGPGRLLKFRLPCDSSDRLFLLKGGFLYELQQASCGDKTSWFMDDAVVQDGSFFSATPFQACSV